MCIKLWQSYGLVQGSIRKTDIKRHSGFQKGYQIAEADGYAVLEAAGVPVDWPIHGHCFTGGWEEASLWLDKYPGSKIGISRVVTYQSKVHIREMVRKIPLDRLFLDTDAPYFPPTRTYRTKNPFTLPGHIIHIAAQVAAIKG